MALMGTMLCLRSVFTRKAAAASVLPAARAFCVVSSCKYRSVHGLPGRGRSQDTGGRRLLGSGFAAQINLPCRHHFRYFCSDGKTREERLIYAGNLAKAVFGVKFFSYSTSIFSCCMMPYIILQTGLGVQSPLLQAAFCGIIGFFTFLSPTVLHFLTKGYVIRLYHSAETDSYTAITYNILLLQKKTIFHQKDVKVPGVSRMFTTFYANEKSMLVNPVLFWHPNDYNHLMGYDQPFSFNLDDIKERD
ncbi:transmembrane protein 70, mitochondrial [Amblyraja radiata]|uniref:transmembrane protein 70, mitochondrial n=1 Tax=Amblyraja radiata TaxID=386614 RepID=UPI0014036D5E|nr:transmembrane protein 70, mitochondrial [Amblyraja radiata]